MRITSLLILVASCTSAMADAPKNVLFLFADDQRYNTIHALGNNDIETPNLDRLVERGTAFTNAYIMGSKHPAVCMPSRAMLMTGRPLFDFGDSPGRVPDSFQLMPAQFRVAGFDTWFTGKWHQDGKAFNRAFAGGDAIFFGGMHDHFAIPVHPYSPEAQYGKDNAVIHQGKHSSIIFADAAIDFLEHDISEKPFFMTVAFTAPHDPRTAPQEYHDKYDAATLPTPPAFLPEHPFDNGELHIRDEELAPFPRTPEIVRQHLADYYAMITHLDFEIGRVLAALEAAGHADDTLIIFSADNGLAVGNHGLMGKQNLYEHSVRVPLVFTGPGIAEGERREALVYISDLFPTLVELFHLPASEEHYARSFAPALLGKEDRGRDSVAFTYKDVQRGVRMGPWKLIRYDAGGEQHVQLFNLDDDPDERNNLAELPEQQERVKELTALLIAELEAQGDPLAKSPDAAIFR